jgi:hypothetical protein
MKLHKVYFWATLLLLPDLSQAMAYEDVDLKNDTLYNPMAYIPPQCYTKTIGANAELHNPCYTCHQQSTAPNYANDDDMQEIYDLPGIAKQNRWKNLFSDHSTAINKISNDQITTYIKTDNYKNAQNHLLLREALQHLPKGSDINGNGIWDGYLPDAYFSFDEEGFDKTPEGQDTGWRAFAYYPLNGTFWPTNGSGDDVLIRLSRVFRENENAHYDRDVYRLNLAIVQALLQRQNVTINTADEKKYGVDLNQNGTLDQAEEVVFKWHRGQLERNTMSYVGRAKQALSAGQVHLAPGLYPKGTEFLHSVRYIDQDDEGNVKLAARMKELRYMKKGVWKTYTQLENATLEELKEESDFPERLEQFSGNPEIGFQNKRGWVLQGFIEDSKGHLRPQNHEESLFCMGCHSGLGVTTDSTFAFPRKLLGKPFRNGWYHWDQKGLQNTPEPKVTLSDGREVYAYTHYLEQNNSGNEFRTNDEVYTKFFDRQGNLKEDMVDKLHTDITVLLAPSKNRAMMLNKAYRALVQQQTFIWGRDATIEPLDNVYQQVPEGQKTGIKQTVQVKGLVPPS